VLLVGSVAAVQPGVEQIPLVETLLTGDEARAVAEADAMAQPAAAYAASKFAITAYARRKAVEWGKLGIRLNVVAPGAVETPLHKASLDDPRFGQAVKNFVAPIGRRPAGRDRPGGGLPPVAPGQLRAWCGDVRGWRHGRDDPPKRF
jgi:NAD(P)-dependent dehydrogenase (short-subunit alcohol dehydrogenase family)